MWRQLAGGLLVVLALAGCTGKPSEIKLDKVMLLGRVNTGYIGEDAYLAEECVENTPYYLIFYRSRLGMAPVYKPDGELASCRQSPPQQPLQLTVQNMGEMGETKNRLATLCIEGVSYWYTSSLYTAGLSPRFGRNGRPQTCQ